MFRRKVRTKHATEFVLTCSSTVQKVTSIQVLAGTCSVLERQGMLISGTPLSCAESMGIFERNCVKGKIRVEIWPRPGPGDKIRSPGTCKYQPYSALDSGQAGIPRPLRL